jgi:hypothetical protein
MRPAGSYFDHAIVEYVILIKDSFSVMNIIMKMPLS